MEGQALRSLSAWPEAARAFERAGAAPFLLADYAFFFRAEALQKAGELDRIVETYRSLGTAHPQSLLVREARLRAGEIDFQMRDFQKALESGEGLMTSPPWKDSGP
ncbi:MAG TPA: hypothetical protein VLS90_05295, partial [Thermodesulfobacteriota bacterium]|nr:hypothetical protein [Thermodesulfobacteriota bacterium]